MALVYLNGNYCPPEQATISPMDRGFLFGDGLYEVVPSYAGRLVGLELHIARLNSGLGAIEIVGAPSLAEWQNIAEQLLASHPEQNLGLYLHVSRGVTANRGHAFPAEPVAPTVFAYAFPIAAPRAVAKVSAANYRVITEQDQRWRRCDVKTTSLLGNVLHYQAGRTAAADETLLFNEAGELTEASTSNVFVLIGNTVYTAPLDHQLLPGVTRQILLNVLRSDGRFEVVERAVSRAELAGADEVWLTSSSREVVAVTQIDQQPVGDGAVGDGWLHAYGLYSTGKYDH